MSYGALAVLHNRIFTSQRGRSILYPDVTPDLFHCRPRNRDAARPRSRTRTLAGKEVSQLRRFFMHCCRRFDIRRNEIATILRLAIFDFCGPPAPEFAAGARNTIAGSSRIEPSRRSRCRGRSVSSDRGCDAHREKTLRQSSFPPWPCWNSRGQSSLPARSVCAFGHPPNGLRPGSGWLREVKYDKLSHHGTAISVPCYVIALRTGGRQQSGVNPICGVRPAEAKFEDETIQQRVDTVGYLPCRL
jgi:hypothetical protein